MRTVKIVAVTFILAWLVTTTPFLMDLVEKRQSKIAECYAVPATTPKLPLRISPALPRQSVSEQGI